MKRFLVTFAIVCLAAVVVGRWYAYRQLLAERRTEAAQREAVERALKEQISTADFAGDGQKLEVLLGELAVRSPAPIKINRREMEQKGLVPQRTLDVPPGVFTLEELLDQATDRNLLGWCRWDDAIVITSRSQADSRNKPFTQVYRLPAGMATGDKVSDDADELCQLISNIMQPDSWDEVGGSGVIRPAGGAIVLHHRPDIHRRVQALLATLKSPSKHAARGFSLEHWPASGEQHIAQALERKDTINFVNEPLGQVAKTLGQRHGITIVLAGAALADAGVSPDTPITKELSNVSLHTILREMLADLQLTYVIRDHVLQITAPEDAESFLDHWMYDVHGLVEPQAGRHFEELIELITSTVEPDSWDAVGGPGVVYAVGNHWLVVGQTQDVHMQVELLLNHAREVLKPLGVDDVLINPAEQISPTVRQALDRQLTLSYPEVPLQDVCDHLTESLGIPLLMRKTQLADVSVYEDTPVTIDLPPLPLRHALALMLHDMKLAFKISGEVIHITTAEDAERNVDIRLLDVRHLTSPGAGGIDERSLAELIRIVVRPVAWDEVGGPGSLSFFQGLLVVAQTDEIQQEVRHLIDVLSEHLLEPPNRKPPESVWIGRSQGEEEILARLQERDSLAITNPNVEETVRMLCARHSIPVLFQKSYRDNADDEPLFDFTLDIKDAPLHEILTKLLAEKGGGFVTWNGVLFITDEAAAESQLPAKLYPVGDRWPGEIKLSGKEFAKLLTSRVDPESWDGVGGPGFTSVVNGDWLLIVQSLAVHSQVEQAIGKLRAGEELPQTPESQPGVAR